MGSEESQPDTTEMKKEIESNESNLSLNSSESNVQTESSEVDISKIKAQSPQADLSWDSLPNIMTNMANRLNFQLGKLPKLNIMLIGKTGTGKSTLINTVFRENLATTGTGKPVTDHVNIYTKANFPLQIFDTPGLELKEAQQKSLKNEICQIIEKRYHSKDMNTPIHCIWYCIASSGNRIEETEIEFIKSFTEEISSTNIPVIVVLTKSYFSDDTNDMKQYIESLKLKIVQVVPVLAKQKEQKMPFGLEDLIDVMENCLPKIMKETLNNVQKVSIKHKRDCAMGAVATAVSLAAAAGASPIPFSDCLVLIPIEAAMITSITIIYGVSLPTGFVAEFLTGTIGCGTVTLLGRFAVVNILKCIPGVGTAIGSAISGATAGVLTTALGSTFIAIIEAIYKGEVKLNELSEEEMKDFITNTFKEKLKISK